MIFRTISNPRLLNSGGRSVILSNTDRSIVGLLVTITFCLFAVDASAQPCETPVAAYEVVDDDRIATPLCGLIGDLTRGRAVFAGRQGNCLACHRAPIAEEKFHGTIGPPLFDVGLHYSSAELRLRLADSSRINPETIMPSFHRIRGLNGVRQDRAGQPILSAQQIEDVIAYLMTLTQEPPAK